MCVLEGGGRGGGGKAGWYLVEILSRKVYAD